MFHSDKTVFTIKMSTVRCFNIRTPKHHFFSFWDKWKINGLGVPLLKHFRE